jgi:hypothetical protein
VFLLPRIKLYVKSIIIDLLSDRSARQRATGFLNDLEKDDTSCMAVVVELTQLHRFVPDICFVLLTISLYSLFPIPLPARYGYKRPCRTHQ